jgi:hypothetical protein
VSGEQGLRVCVHRSRLLNPERELNGFSQRSV